MTETWLYDQGDKMYITDMTPDGYQFYSFPWCGRRGEGIALVSKCSLKSISVKQLNYQSFEAVEAKLFHSGKSMSFVCLYRPPPSRVNKFTDKMFQDEFSGLVAYLASWTGESVIVGDFNYHFNCGPVAQWIRRNPLTSRLPLRKPLESKGPGFKSRQIPSMGKNVRPLWHVTWS